MEERIKAIQHLKMEMKLKKKTQLETNMKVKIQNVQQASLRQKILLSKKKSKKYTGTKLPEILDTMKRQT